MATKDISDILMTPEEVEALVSEFRDKHSENVASLETCDEQLRTNQQRMSAIVGEIQERKGYAAIDDPKTGKKFRSMSTFISRRLGVSRQYAYGLKIKVLEIMPNIKPKALPMPDDGTGGVIAEPSVKQATMLKRIKNANKQAAVWDQVCIDAQTGKDGKPRVTQKALKQAIDAAIAEDIETIKLPKGTTDGGLKTLSPKITKALMEAATFADLIKDVRQIKARVKSLAKVSAARHLNVQDVQTHLNDAVEALSFAAPYGPCLYCKGKGCDACKKNGWLPRGIYTQAERDKETARKSKQK